MKPITICLFFGLSILSSCGGSGGGGTKSSFLPGIASSQNEPIQKSSSPTNDEVLSEPITDASTSTNEVTPSGVETSIVTGFVESPAQDSLGGSNENITSNSNIDPTSPQELNTVAESLPTNLVEISEESQTAQTSDSSSSASLIEQILSPELSEVLLPSTVVASDDPILVAMEESSNQVESANQEGPSASEDLISYANSTPVGESQLDDSVTQDSSIVNNDTTSSQELNAVAESLPENLVEISEESQTAQTSDSSSPASLIEQILSPELSEVLLPSTEVASDDPILVAMQESANQEGPSSSEDLISDTNTTPVSDSVIQDSSIVNTDSTPSQELNAGAESLPYNLVEISEESQTAQTSDSSSPASLIEQILSPELSEVLLPSTEVASDDPILVAMQESANQEGPSSSEDLISDTNTTPVSDSVIQDSSIVNTDSTPSQELNAGAESLPYNLVEISEESQTAQISDSSSPVNVIEQIFSPELSEVLLPSTEVLSNDPILVAMEGNIVSPSTPEEVVSLISEDVLSNDVNPVVVTGPETSQTVEQSSGEEVQIVDPAPIETELSPGIIAEIIDSSHLDDPTLDEAINEGYPIEDLIIFNNINFSELVPVGFENTKGQIVKGNDGKPILNNYVVSLETELVLDSNDKEGFYQVAVIANYPLQIETRTVKGVEKIVNSQDKNSFPTFSCMNESKLIRMEKNKSLSLKISSQQGSNPEKTLMLMWRKVADLENDKPNKKQMALETRCGEGGDHLFYDDTKGIQPTQALSAFFKQMKKRNRWEVLDEGNFLVSSKKNKKKISNLK